ncbi:MAG: DUF5662 family protein [bacterium]
MDGWPKDFLIRRIMGRPESLGICSDCGEALLECKCMEGEEFKNKKTQIDCVPPKNNKNLSTYDSKEETEKHISYVRELLDLIVLEINNRSENHDISKLKEPEKSIFDKVTPKLRKMTYGSDEYKQSLTDMEPALTHHYKFNRHHPEYYRRCEKKAPEFIRGECHKNGIEDMTLIDLIEMLVDWKAATERHADGDLKKSFEINEKRFNIPKPLLNVLSNTAKQFGWLENKKENEPPIC